MICHRLQLETIPVQHEFQILADHHLHLHLLFLLIHHYRSREIEGKSAGMMMHLDLRDCVLAQLNRQVRLLIPL